jgi:hypothetical protein
VPFLDSMYEGPTVRFEPTPPQTRPPRGRGLAVVAVTAAVLALGAAAFAAHLGWQALDSADGARELAALDGPAPGATPAAASSPASSATSPPASPAASSVPPPADASLLIGGSPGASPGASAGSAWAVRYTGKVLTVRAGCSGHIFLDLDEPRAEVAGPGTDVQSRCTGSGTHLALGPGAEAAAEIPPPGAGTGAAAPDATPDAAACEQRLRTDPLADGAAAVVAKGLVLCVRTTPAGTASPTLVRLEVTAVDTDRTTLLATAWTAS